MYKMSIVFRESGTTVDGHCVRNESNCLRTLRLTPTLTRPTMVGSLELVIIVSCTTAVCVNHIVVVSSTLTIK